MLFILFFFLSLDWSFLSMIFWLRLLFVVDFASYFSSFFLFSALFFGQMCSFYLALILGLILCGFFSSWCYGFLYWFLSGFICGPSSWVSWFLARLFDLCNGHDFLMSRWCRLVYGVCYFLFGYVSVPENLWFLCLLVSPFIFENFYWVISFFLTVIIIVDLSFAGDDCDGI